MVDCLLVVRLSKTGIAPGWQSLPGPSRELALRAASGWWPEGPQLIILEELSPVNSQWVRWEAKPAPGEPWDDFGPSQDIAWSLVSKVIIYSGLPGTESLQESPGQMGRVCRPTHKRLWARRPTLWCNKCVLFQAAAWGDPHRCEAIENKYAYIQDSTQVPALPGKPLILQRVCGGSSLLGAVTAFCVSSWETARNIPFCGLLPLSLFL